MEKICKNCKYAEIDDNFDLRCINPESDSEFTNDDNNDNYLDVVDCYHSCPEYENKDILPCK